MSNAKETTLESVASIPTRQQLVEFIKEIDELVQDIGRSIISDYKIKTESNPETSDKSGVVLLNEFNEANTAYLNRAKELSSKRLNIIEMANEVSNDALSLLQTVDYLDMNYYSILKKIQEIDQTSSELLKIASLMMKAKIMCESNHIIGSINSFYTFKLLEKNTHPIISALGSEKERDNFVKNRYRGIERIKNECENIARTYGESITIISNATDKIEKNLKRMDNITNNKLALNLMEAKERI